MVQLMPAKQQELKDLLHHHGEKSLGEVTVSQVRVVCGGVVCARAPHRLFAV